MYMYLVSVLVFCVFVYVHMCVFWKVSFEVKLSS